MMEDVRVLLASVYSPSIEILSTQSVGGGSINQTLLLTLSNGEKVFLKHNDHPPQDFFKREAAGLRLLGQSATGPRVPRPLAWQSRFLIMEFIQEQAPSADFYPDFGRALADMHRRTQDRYGLDHDNHIGSTPQKNTLEKDGLTFFRDHRLRFQQKLARDRGRLPKSLDLKLDSLFKKLDTILDLTGEQPALVHGDLWSGNYFCDASQRACIFDPAVHFGLRETDLAMMELFGQPPQTFYKAYQEAFPSPFGYSERREIYNLYHLLNHVNLFGSSYLSSVESTVNRFIR
ncbi:MAG: fructosamine kinase family protein [Nitrospina sp.]|nr:MAG: fructosamine kinase family protein [Nitrospina sp.]